MFSHKFYSLIHNIALIVISYVALPFAFFIDDVNFDFYANAQYPLIMRQQQQNDSVLKDLFGVNGSQLQELKQAITGLQKGELITKDAQAMALGIGKHWKKIKVTHLI